MKIKSNDFQKLKEAVIKVIKEHPNAMKVYKEQELSKARFTWDVFHVAANIDRTLYDLYQYLNDSHIDTAMRKIVDY